MSRCDLRNHNWRTHPACRFGGQVKWFSSSKGYGFVQLPDGTGDVFLHATAPGGVGLSALQPGETLEMRVASGHPRASFGSPSDRQPLEASVQEMGTVKWYNAMKGFGFIVRDSSGRDVFVHVSALERAGITGLKRGLAGVGRCSRGSEGTRSRLDPTGLIGETRRGFEAQ